MQPIQEIDFVIYFYIVICIALLLFNVGYIFRSKGRKRARAKRRRRWKKLLTAEVARYLPEDAVDGTPRYFRSPNRYRQKQRQTEEESAAHQQYLIKRLRHTEELAACNEVLDRLVLLAGIVPVQAYIYANRSAFRELALRYGKKDAMERAFFAYVISTYHPPIGQVHDSLVEILLSYMDNSTVFCRENVLNALYALGNEQAVEHAFQRLNDENWFHHSRLLSDGLIKFTGDQAALVRRLCRHKKQWAEFLLVAVVQFAATVGSDFSQEFLKDLEDTGLPLEVRFALVRYFQRHTSPQVRPILLRYVRESANEENGLAIVAAAALQKYPGRDTKETLKAALHSRDWYVRHNAAASLAVLGLQEEDIADIRVGGDRYAIEMLEYVMEGRQETIKAESGEEAISA